MTSPTDKSSILDKLGEIAATKLLPKLVELLWPRLEEFFLKVVVPKLVALFPLFAASIAEKVIDQIPGVNLVKSAVDMAEEVRDQVNVAVPDFDIPILSDIFDLTEFLNKGK